MGNGPLDHGDLSGPLCVHPVCIETCDNYERAAEMTAPSTGLSGLTGCKLMLSS